MKNLNFFCAALMLLVSINSVAANYITLGDEVRIHPRYLDGYFKVDATMHIEGMCDDWQMAVTYPQSLSVKLVSGITPLSGMTLTYSDNNGKLIRYDAPLTVSAAYANISSHISVTGWDFDEFGNYMPYGSVKWMPGDYEMFELNLYVDPRYRDGNITFDGVLSSGYDTRGAVLQGVRFIRSTRFWVGYLPGDVTGSRRPDFYYSPTGALNNDDKFIVQASAYNCESNTTPLFTLENWDNSIEAPLKWLEVPASTPVEKLCFLKNHNNVALIIKPDNVNVSGCQQALIHALVDAGIDCPVVMRNTYNDTDTEWLQVKAGADLGAVLLNGMGDGVWLEAPACDNQDQVVGYSFAILQAARLRTTKTEFISCPSCGRTMFDLQTTVHRVQQATSHLTHLKIGVMGCVVNGPGEMADADYGYVGAAVGKISLYKGKQCIEKNIPEADAIPRLIALIKENGDWIEP